MKDNISKFYNKEINKVKDLEDLEIAKHRLVVANEFINCRKEHLIPEIYNDLQFIINECNLDETW